MSTKNTVHEGEGFEVFVDLLDSTLHLRIIDARVTLEAGPNSSLVDVELPDSAAALFGHGHEQAKKIEALEQLRPHWAQGYTSDSMAAQASTTALSEVWVALGVKNQTACMQMLRDLLKLLPKLTEAADAMGTATNSGMADEAVGEAYLLIAGLPPS